MTAETGGPTPRIDPARVAVAWSIATQVGAAGASITSAMDALALRLGTWEEDLYRVKDLLAKPQGQRVERVNLFETVHDGGWVTAFRIITDDLVVLCLQAPPGLEYIVPLVRTLVPVILPQLPADSLYPENESGAGELRIVLGND